MDSTWIARTCAVSHQEKSRDQTRHQGFKTRTNVSLFAGSEGVWYSFPQSFTASINKIRILKVKAQPTNAIFATVNQMFGDSSQLPSTAERAAIK